MEVEHEGIVYTLVISNDKTDAICEVCEAKRNVSLCEKFCAGENCAGYYEKKKMKKRIYVSGQMTGLPNNNEEAFNVAEENLKKMGFLVINPVRNGLPATAAWSQHMVKDIEDLFTCDSIYLLDGWALSKGARIEASIASVMKMQIFHEKRDCEWLVNQQLEDYLLGYI